MITAGIDAGSRTIKAVLFDSKTRKILASGLVDQGVAQDERAKELFGRLIKEARLKAGDVARIVATGYGRNLVTLADTTVTEITCHAVGVRHLVPKARTVIDIGGQDSKLIRLDEDGSVRDFCMNDRCAAGTGRFLEVTAARLEVDLESLGDQARKSRAPAIISSMCVVFAETEIVGLLAAGTKPADIIAGVQASIAQRMVTMAGSVTGPVVFTGGVALISGMDRALASAFAQRIAVAPQPQLTGALGAAILAGREAIRPGR